MADIEPGGDIVICRVYDVNQDRDQDLLRVRIPLQGHMTKEWLRWYQRLARVKDVPARAEDLTDRSWIDVRVPAHAEPEKLRAILDSARDLIAEADMAAEQPPAMAEAEAAVREWWATQSV